MDRYYDCHHMNYGITLTLYNKSYQTYLQLMTEREKMKNQYTSHTKNDLNQITFAVPATALWAAPS